MAINVFKQRDNVEEFRKQTLNASPAEKRRWEMKLLKAIPTPKQGDDNPLPYNPITQYIKMYFPNREDYMMMLEYLKVSHSVETSSKDVSIFVAAVRQVQEGSLAWDEENKVLVPRGDT